MRSEAGSNIFSLKTYVRRTPLYDRLGIDYDTTRRPDSRILARLAHYVLQEKPGNYLDVGCGTGNYTSALAGSDYNFHGIDQSALMIHEARAKNKRVNWYVADAESLPFKDASFSGALCTSAIHHIENLPALLKEVHRVMTGGSFVIFTSTPAQMSGYWLNEYFPCALRRSAKQMSSLEYLVDTLRLVGFTNTRSEIYQVDDSLNDFFLYSGKYRPRLYLSPKFRAGISTFANLIDDEELEHGCRQLALDLETGRIEQVIKSYRHEGGDYLFVVADKVN